MVSPEGERLQLVDKIDPKGQNVEAWMLELEGQMRSTVRNEGSAENVGQRTVAPPPIISSERHNLGPLPRPHIDSRVNGKLGGLLAPAETYTAPTASPIHNGTPTFVPTTLIPFTTLAAYRSEITCIGQSKTICASADASGCRSGPACAS